MPAGIGASGALGVALEPAAAPGAWVTPAVWIPITGETLAYTEDRYFSEAIRQQTISNAVAQGPYHVEGDVNMEFDCRYVPYFLYATRHTITKTGATAPFSYKLVPASGGGLPTGNRTLSLTVVRNGVQFRYSGCQVGSFEITIDAGVTRFNATIMGTTMATSAAAITPSFSAPRLLSSISQSIAIGDNALITAVASGGTAMTGATVNTSFNGFTFTVNDNPSAENRINQNRSASYIAYHITEANVTTELDFLDKVDYDHYVATDSKRLQFISGQVSGATPITQNRVTVDVYNSVFEEYSVNLGSWSDLTMATSNFHIISSGGAAPPFDMFIENDQDIVVT